MSFITVAIRDNLLALPALFSRYGSPNLAWKKKSSYRSGAYKSISVAESVSVPASAVLRLKRVRIVHWKLRR
ncbi:hypothetical protein L1987_46019 [Smallanthus sonchifolius]|uniref:Uncharacterized protein n=1 Tax=Smallanthus sonchifolius TaxID=185202 RepID=A0ACB9FZM0_9ASTR|nr:hypothetical protein L1987_46019 [Smallanthus sonchifolius]